MNSMFIEVWRQYKRYQSKVIHATKLSSTHGSKTHLFVELKLIVTLELLSVWTDYSREHSMDGVGVYMLTLCNEIHW